MKKLLITALSLLGASTLFAGMPGRGFHIPALYHTGFWIHDIAKSRAFYETYLGFEEPYVLNLTTGPLQMSVMKVNEHQVIYLFPNPARIKPNGDNLDHLGLETDNAAAMYEYLRSRGVKVSEAHRGRIGDLILGVKDPDGNSFEVTQFEPEGELLKHQGKNLPSSRISDHLRSVSVRVANIDASVRFYVDVLGFTLVQKFANGVVRVQVPDGSDFIDLLPPVPNADPVKTWAVPDYRLEVASVEKAVAILKSRAGSDFPLPQPITVGPDGAKRTSVTDPDGVSIVIAEPAPAVGP